MWKKAIQWTRETSWFSFQLGSCEIRLLQDFVHMGFRFKPIRKVTFSVAK
jgi:hypothetical protein